MDPGGEFHFQSLPNYKFANFETPKVKECLGKWSMVDGLKLQAYSFDKPFKKYHEREFLTDFFACQNVFSSLMAVSSKSNRDFSPLGIPVDVVKFSEMRCTLTTLEVFDKLKKEDRIVRPNGAIVKCMPCYIKAVVDDNSEGLEIEVADNLRKAIISCEDDDDYDTHDLRQILSHEDRKEFIVSLFSHAVIGGSLCQYEDFVEPYLDITKLLYKDLIAVAAKQDSTESDNVSGDQGENVNTLKVISHVYRIHSASNETVATGKKECLLFNRSYLNNFFYVIVNPLKQVCFTVYHHV